CCIVNTASIAGLLPAFNAPIYSASKHAVVGLTEVLNFQLQDVGSKVRAFVLCPGYIATNLHNCMENRPSEYTGEDDYFKSADFKERYDIMTANVINGISVEKLIDIIFDALEKDKYYIHTHEEFLPLIEKRASNIAKGKRPRSPGQYKIQKSDK
ncbi:MAG: SDR family NAD(P)-dependent oxidoreductase, partial [Syntrophomonadaceae bacterium]|nr:SDR family NAD(P)-dependent oxidoreductase [Syntrophomonadaceae bacterium]